jgi:hypothetical protein
MVTVDPDTEAMAGCELSYENAPGLLDIGGVKLNERPYQYVWFAIVKLVMVGAGAGVAIFNFNVSFSLS